MVDNFEQIEKFLTFTEPGDCYYVQLLRRQADDPLIDGKKDPKYHGNMHSRSIKDYFIKSVDQLKDVKEDIITLCKTFNVRAYIRLNKRNYKHMALAMLKHISEQVYCGQTFSSPLHLVASAAGMACAAGKNKTWIVDIDQEYLQFKDAIYDMMLLCAPYFAEYEEWCNRKLGDRKAFIEKTFTEIPTKNGLHIIARPFHTEQFSELWHNYATANGLTVTKDNAYILTMPPPDLHKDNPTILYVP